MIDITANASADAPAIPAAFTPLTLPQLPERCDVLVLGAGPAGSAAARLLAQAGRSVVLVDAQRFPRDKVCGDGLVPDTHAALRALGVLDRVLARARVLPHAHCVAPRGQAVDVPGELSVLPRRELDAILCKAAVEAGALLATPVRFEQLLRAADGRVTGATLRQGSERRDVQAPWVILATGAGAAPLVAAGVCERRGASAMALRTYFHHPALARELTGMRFVWHPALRGGYGWIFPGPEGNLNLGVGVLDGRSSGDEDGAKGPNLRRLYDTFVTIDPVARRLVSEGQQLGEVKGAPLRCDLEGATWSQPGLLVVGDAVGATYSFTGEGIGKAMETGMAAAAALQQAQAAPGPAADAQVQASYHAALTALQPRFALYRRAASFNRRPWTLDLVVWRARRSARLVNRLADILNERRMPGSLFSWRGLRAMILG